MDEEKGEDLTIEVPCVEIIVKAEQVKVEEK